MLDRASDEVVAGKLKGSAFLSKSVKEFWVLELMKPVEGFCARTTLTPNMISTIGFGFTMIAAYLIATNHLIFGGWMIIWAGCCDFLDGRIARIKNLQTQSGAFYDSVLDRYMDFAVFAGLAYLFRDSPWQSVVFVALLGAMTTPYIKAKSESLGIDASGGEMQRPERIVVIGVGALLSGYLTCMAYPWRDVREDLPPYILYGSLLIVAVASNKAAFGRFWSTFQKLQEIDKRR